MRSILFTLLLAFIVSGCYTTSTSVRRSEKPVPVGISAWPVAPPRLGTKLEGFYPEEARARALYGSAKLRIRVLEDGTIRVAEILDSTDRMFGNACVRMLSTTQWEPARDTAGRPIAVEVSYACEFKPVKTCVFCARHENPEAGL